MTDAAIPPRAPRRAKTITQHGQTRIDDYAWMKVHNWREVMRDPSVLEDELRDHLEAENAYTKAWLADTETLQETLFAEMRGRIKEDDSSVPSKDGRYAYYSRFREGGQYPVFARKTVDLATGKIADEEEILFDGDKEGEGQDYFDLGTLSHSPDHTILAYGVDLKGSEFYEIRFRMIDTGEELPDILTGASGSMVWANDSKTLLWVERDENNRPRRVKRHVLGAPPESDVVVYEEEDQGFFVGVDKTESRRFLVIDAHDHTTSEVRLIPADAPDSEPVLIAARDPGVEYDVTDNGETLYLVTNVDGAVDFKLMTAPVASPGRENWTEWRAHEPGVLILGQSMFARFHVRLERVNALPRIVIHTFDTGEEHHIALDEEAYGLGLGGGYEFDTRQMRFSYSSPTTPSQLFDYDMASRERTLLKTQEIPSGHTASHYVVRRITAKSHDGAAVPVTILHHKDTPLDGSAPALLYGYGSYGHTVPASFGTGRLSLVDRGMIYAIAHIRGGMAKGYQWYLDGKLEKKPNTFHDFVAAGEALAKDGYSARGKIICLGGSAGGLLVGASVNMAPDLFGGVVAAVPFVDVLNTMSDEELPLTPPEWPEWGKPAHRPRRIRGHRRLQPL